MKLNELRQNDLILYCVRKDKYIVKILTTPVTSAYGEEMFINVNILKNLNIPYLFEGTAQAIFPKDNIHQTFEKISDPDDIMKELL